MQALLSTPQPPLTIMKKHILIYNDLGASSDCVSELLRYFDGQNTPVKTVSGADLQKRDWLNTTRLLIMPGGRSLPFYQTLGDQGNQNIIQFVVSGGVYLGLCAGAYYACSQTIFAKDLPEELVLPGPLNFFKGKAIGPVFAAEDFAYQSEQGARIVKISYDGDVYPVYFNGGCYFEGADNAQVIAHYEENNLPAIIRADVKKGRVILSGIHPELSFSSIPDDDNAHHQRLRNQLQLTDIKRNKLLGAIFNVLLNK